jgi:hypothetical protein
MQNRIDHNRIDIDRTHSRAICREIGERLRAGYLREQPEPSAGLQGQIDRLRKVDDNRLPSTEKRRAV